MNSETLVTLLLSVLAITFGIISARQKKRNASVTPPVRHDSYDMDPEPRKEHQFQYSRSTIDSNEMPEEAPPATSPDADKGSFSEDKTPAEKRKYGFNAKEAVLYSEILKPKFDEFG